MGIFNFYYYYYFVFTGGTFDPSPSIGESVTKFLRSPNRKYFPLESQYPFGDFDGGPHSLKRVDGNRQWFIFVSRSRM